MAIIDNTIAGQMPAYDAGAPLLQAAQIQQQQQAARKAQFDQSQNEMGAEARGLVPYVNTPDFPAKWAETTDRLRERGLINDQMHSQWRNAPSPLLLKQMIAKTESPELAFRRDEAVRNQTNTDRTLSIQERTLAGGKVAPGFMQKPDGTQTFIPGSAADPAYIQATNEAKAKPREFGYADVEKLTEEGGKFTSINRFADNFKDSYGGEMPGLGDATNWIRRTAPDGIITQEARQAGTYWQDYDKYKNVVRNDLFGAALTATEQAAFEKADINNTMAPAAIRANLKIQKDILEGAMKRKAGSLIASGYNPQAISQAYGVPLDKLGVEQQGKSRTDTGGAKPAALKPAPATTLESAKAAIAQGADPAAVKKRIQDAGFDPAGL